MKMRTMTSTLVMLLLLMVASRTEGRAMVSWLRPCTSHVLFSHFISLLGFLPPSAHFPEKQPYCVQVILDIKFCISIYLGQGVILKTCGDAWKLVKAKYYLNFCIALRFVLKLIPGMHKKYNKIIIILRWNYCKFVIFSANTENIELGFSKIGTGTRSHSEK